MNTQEIRGRWDQIRGKVKKKWGQLTDDDLQLVGGNVDQVIGRIEQKTGEARNRVEQFLDELALGRSPAAALAGTVSSAAQSAAHSVREGIGQVKEQARQGYERAGEMVESHPGQSMAAVFGLGFLSGILIGMLMRSEG